MIHLVPVQQNKISECLTDILDLAKGHPLFCEVTYNDGTMEALCELGGDAATFVEIALNASWALKILQEAVNDAE